MYCLILFFLVGVLNAFMDTVEEGRFGRSIFQKLDPRFWYKWQSWKYAKRLKIVIKRKVFMDYPIDAWHIAKSLMWTCVALGAIVYQRTGPIFPCWSLDFLAIGYTIMLTFNLFYDHIFKKP